MLVVSDDSDYAKIESTVRTTQRVYLAIALAQTSGSLAELVSRGIVYSFFQELIQAAIYLVLYFGLRYRMTEMIPLVLIVSMSHCVGIFVLGLRPAQSIRELIIKIAALAFSNFFAYQVVFFRRADVRALFKDKGTLIY